LFPCFPSPFLQPSLSLPLPFSFPPEEENKRNPSLTFSHHPRINRPRHFGPFPFFPFRRLPPQLSELERLLTSLLLLFSSPTSTLLLLNLSPPWRLRPQSTSRSSRSSSTTAGSWRLPNTRLATRSNSFGTLSCSPCSVDLGTLQCMEELEVHLGRVGSRL